LKKTSSCLSTRTRNHPISIKIKRKEGPAVESKVYRTARHSQTDLIPNQTEAACSTRVQMILWLGALVEAVSSMTLGMQKNKIRSTAISWSKGLKRDFTIIQ
jgi:hypothetical protein